MQFTGDGVVGGLFDVHKTYGWNWLLENQEAFYRSMPFGVRFMAEKMILPYLLQNVDGEIRPLVSAVFWNSGDTLTSAVSWTEFMENGGHILECRFMDPESAWPGWCDAYQLTDDEMEFAKGVFVRKKEVQGDWLDLTEIEAEWLQKQVEDDDGMKQCRKSFAELRIFVPCL